MVPLMDKINRNGVSNQAIWPISFFGEKFDQLLIIRYSFSVHLVHAERDVWHILCLIKVPFGFGSCRCRAICTEKSLLYTEPLCAILFSWYLSILNILSNQKVKTVTKPNLVMISKTLLIRGFMSNYLVFLLMKNMPSHDREKNE